MDIFDVIHSHFSVRQYKSDPVPEDLLEKILKAGIRASSSGNMQSYSIIVTSDPKIKQQLFEPHFEQPMVLEAPLLLTFCADFHRMRLWLKNSDAKDNFDNFMSFMIAAIDALLVSQNVALAAEAEGLGICYMGTTLASCDKIADILKLPNNVVPVAGFSMGYSATPNGPVRDRLPLDGLVHREVYQDYTPERITEIYKDREIAGWKRYMDNPGLKAMVEEKGVQNLAQIYTTVKYTRESHIGYSKVVLKCLADRGFFNHEG